MDKQKFLASGLLEQYVLGLTTPEENEVVQAHLEAFPELKGEVQAMHDALCRYAAMQSIPPPPSKRNAGGKITQKNEKITPAFNSAPSERLVAWVFIAASLLLGSLSFMFWQEKHTLQHALNRQRAEMSLLEQHCASQRYDAQMFALLSHADTKQIRLSRQDKPTLPCAMAYWNPTAKRAFINAASLLDPPHGHQYQVWADVDGHMIPVALLEPTDKHLTSISFQRKATSINLTLEPKGGSPQPTLSKLAYAGEVW